ncbi:hypothetical protein EMGBS1_04150, partial [Chloroflexota bacterium]
MPELKLATMKSSKLSAKASRAAEMIPGVNQRQGHLVKSV